MTSLKKEATRLIRKFPSLKQELTDLSITLTNEPETGTPLGNDTYKIRLAIKSKGKGKSGGARVITYAVTDNKEVDLLTIYDKSEFDSVGGEENIKALIIRDRGFLYAQGGFSDTAGKVLAMVVRCFG